MSEPRYPARVSDPDETTRIPKDALEGLRDADQAREGGRPANGSASSGPGSAGRRRRVPRPGGSPSNGSSGAAAVDATPVGPASGGGATAVALGRGARRPAGRRPAGRSSAPAPTAPAGRPAASAASRRRRPRSRRRPPRRPPAIRLAGRLPGRSETGYSPAAYQGSYSSAYPSLADAPTTVTGPGGPGPAAGAGVGAAGRSSPGGAGRPSPAARGTGSGRPPRRARLLVRHIDTWSTLKFSFVLSVALFFVWLVAVGVLYGVLDGMGVFDQLNEPVRTRSSGRRRRPTRLARPGVRLARR